MAIEYVLDIDSELGAEEFSMRLGEHLWVNGVEERPGLWRFACPFLYFTIMGCDQRSSQYIWEDYRVRSTLSVLFRLNKFELKQAQDIMVPLVVAALHTSPGDAVLRHNFETPVLRRTAGCVSLNRGFTGWNSRMALFEDQIVLGPAFEP